MVLNHANLVASVTWRAQPRLRVNKTQLLAYNQSIRPSFEPSHQTWVYTSTRVANLSHVNAVTDQAHRRHANDPVFEAEMYIYI